MGGTESQPSDQQNSFSDERFGGKIAVATRRNKSYVVKVVTVSTEEEMNQLLNLTTNRARLKHRNFCTIRNYELEKKSDFCTDHCRIEMYFDWHPNDLQKEIARRRDAQQEHFSEDWICAMLFGLVDCLRYLDQKGCYQGDIKPSNILLDENNTPKLVDSYFTHFGRSNFQLVLSNPTTMAYLSPEQLTTLRKGHYSNMPENKSKCQIFSLGMTVIQAMLLCSSIDLYEMNLLRLVEQKVLQRRQVMVKFYSPQLCDLVLSMVAIDEQKRPNFSEMLSHPLLRQHSNKISLSNMAGSHVKSSRASYNNDMDNNRRNRNTNN